MDAANSGQNRPSSCRRGAQASWCCALPWLTQGISRTRARARSCAWHGKYLAMAPLERLHEIRDSYWRMHQDHGEYCPPELEDRFTPPAVRQPGARSVSRAPVHLLRARPVTDARGLKGAPALRRAGVGNINKRAIPQIAVATDIPKEFSVISWTRSGPYRGRLRWKPAAPLPRRPVSDGLLHTAETPGGR